MFWNETEGQYTPAGWRSLVPEYLEDPTVLRCPRDEPGTLSYELLFPATSRAELAAIYADIHGLDAAEVEREALMDGIPVAYEPKPHLIDGREFRTVLFLDGHVGLFHDRDWAKFVEPYLQYSVR
jgi:prepilin-type processing-associated H-X9-DG protein